MTKLSRGQTLAVSLLAAALLAPIAVAHGAVNAREVEVLVLKDELSDVQTSLAGYDLGEFYVAEAWLAGLGDGFYFHTIFFGAFPGNPPSDEYRVVFTIDAGGPEPIQRFIATRDGQDFETDFDALELNAEGEQVEVDRAFIAGSTTGLARGAVIKSFVVESFADGEIRDRAPGSIYAPGSDGRVELPGQGSSSQVVPSYTLAGPVNYATAAFTTTGDDAYSVKIVSKLTKGAQHVHLEVPEWSLDDPMFTGWTFEIVGEGGGEIPANGSRDVAFKLVPMPDENGLVMPQMLNVTTDIGGRLGFQIRATNAGVEFVPEADVTDWTPAALPLAQADSPGFGILAGLAAVAVAIFVAGRRR